MDKNKNIFEIDADDITLYSSVIFSPKYPSL